MPLFCPRTSIFYYIANLHGFKLTGENSNFIMINQLPERSMIITRMAGDPHPGHQSFGLVLFTCIYPDEFKIIDINQFSPLHIGKDDHLP